MERSGHKDVHLAEVADREFGTEAPFRPEFFRNVPNTLDDFNLNSAKYVALLPISKLRNRKSVGQIQSFGICAGWRFETSLFSRPGFFY
jgi:hypothetical protein